MIVKFVIYQLYMAYPSVSFCTPQLDILELWTWDLFDAENSDSNRMSSDEPILSTHLLLALTLFFIQGRHLKYGTVLSLCLATQKALFLKVTIHLPRHRDLSYQSLAS